MKTISPQINEKYNNLIKELDNINLKDILKTYKAEVQSLKSKTQKPNFWDNVSKAQAISKKLGKKEKQQNNLQKFINMLEDLNFMYNEINNGEKEYINDFEKILQKVVKKFNQIKVQKFLNSEFDQEGAIFSIFAGQGGTEAHDWADMLKRMYLRYFDKQDWEYEIIDESPSEEAGINSITIKIDEDYAYGYLKVEHGTHRLVRQSPFNAQNLRQTSFAGVEVIPLIKKNSNIEINDEDIEFSAVRSSGSGGQNVNKVATSVRIKHIPTGINVSSSASRSQLKNRENAMEILKGKLIFLKEQEQAKKIKNAKGDVFKASWGNQIRNYVLHPYKLVKDTRTNFETTDTESILDGELDDFINSGIVYLAEEK